MHANRSKPATHEERIERAKVAAKREWEDAIDIEIERSDSANKNGISTVHGKARLSDGKVIDFYVTIDIHTRRIRYIGEVQNDVYEVAATGD